MRSSCLVFVALAAAFIAGGAICAHSAESKPAGNLEVISRLISEIAAELQAAFPGEVAERGVYLQSSADDEKYQVIKNVFTSSFAEHGITVYSSARTRTANTPDSAAAEPQRLPFRLEIRALEFAIWYPKIFRSFLIGGKKVEREASVAISATLLNLENDSVVWVKEAKKTYHDRFSFQMLSQVENDLFTFTKPEKKATNWSRIVEPVVVSGIIVGLIYLFFSNQSSD